MNPTVVDLHDNWGPAEWVHYVRESMGVSVGGIIGSARRLAQAHDTYNRHPERWAGVSFDAWVKEHLGYRASAVSQLEAVAEVFGKFSTEKLSMLPASWSTLYHLALAARADLAAFDAALEAGRVSPSMTRAEAQELAYEIMSQDERVRARQQERAQRRQARQQAKTAKDEAAVADATAAAPADEAQPKAPTTTRKPKPPEPEEDEERQHEPKPPATPLRKHAALAHWLALGERYRPDDFLEYRDSKRAVDAKRHLLPMGIEGIRDMLSATLRAMGADDDDTEIVADFSEIADRLDALDEPRLHEIIDDFRCLIVDLRQIIDDCKKPAVRD